MSLENLDKEVQFKTESLAEVIQAKADRKLKVAQKYIKSFEAAQFNRLNSSWTAVDFSPAQELYNDLKVLKTRSRDLYCNSPVVSNFVSLLQQNIVGHKGFTFKSKVLNSKNNLNSKMAKQIEEAWSDFSKAGNFEVTGSYGLTDALDMMVQSLAVDGEILLKKIPGRGKYGFQVQLLHSEQLIISKHEAFDMGIRRDEYGKPVEYCLTDRHPGEGLTKFIYEPATAILHAYIPYQIGAPRGVPMSSSAMQTIKMLDEYRKSELVAARLEASKFMIYKQKQIDDLDPDIAMEAALPASIKHNTITPGMAEVLAPGMEAEFMNPTHPNSAFDSFSRSLKKEIAAGLGLSYNSLYSDFENTSFSSMRAAFISERAFYRKLQALVIEKVLDPIFEAFIDAACLSGKLKLEPVLGSYDAYKAHEFIAKAYEFSNPLQEAQAQVMLVDNRLMSKTQIAAERGVSYEDILNDIKAEQDLEASKGIKFEILPKGAVISAIPDGATTTTPNAGSTPSV
jgi:lambda family phage portal protein